MFARAATEEIIRRSFKEDKTSPDILLKFLCPGYSAIISKYRSDYENYTLAKINRDAENRNNEDKYAKYSELAK